MLILPHGIQRLAFFAVLYVAWFNVGVIKSAEALGIPKRSAANPWCAGIQLPM